MDATEQASRFVGPSWTTGQLRTTLGWRDIATAASSGVISHPWRGAYHLPDGDLVCRLTALQASVGGPVIACHSTAAQLHGFGVLDDGLLHVTSPGGRSSRQRPGVVIHQQIPRHPLVSYAAILSIDPAEAAIDVARSAREIDVLPILDSAVKHGVHRADLLNAVERARRSRGIIQVRRWVGEADPLAESAMESRTRFRVLDAGLPRPESQLVISLPMGRVRRLDLGWRHRRVGLEYDSEEFHTGDGMLVRDRRRHNELTGAGWTIVYATATDIFRDPEPLIAQLRSLLN